MKADNFTPNLRNNPVSLNSRLQWLESNLDLDDFEIKLDSVCNRVDIFLEDVKQAQILSNKTGNQ